MYKITGNIDNLLIEKHQERFMGQTSITKREKKGILAVSGNLYFWKVWDLIILLNAMYSLMDDVFYLKLPELRFSTKVRTVLGFAFYLDILFNFFRARTDHVQQYQYLIKVFCNYLK